MKHSDDPSRWLPNYTHGREKGRHTPDAPIGAPVRTQTERDRIELRRRESAARGVKIQKVRKKFFELNGRMPNPKEHRAIEQMVDGKILPDQSAYVTIVEPDAPKIVKPRRRKQMP